MFVNTPADSISRTLQTIQRPTREIVGLLQFCFEDKQQSIDLPVSFKNTTPYIYHAEIRIRYPCLITEWAILSNLFYANSPILWKRGLARLSKRHCIVNSHFFIATTFTRHVILQLSISTNLLRSSLMVASHVRILVSYTATPRLTKCRSCKSVEAFISIFADFKSPRISAKNG
jgi:hypothetical protein